MKNNHLVKGLVILSLVGTMAMADNETNDDTNLNIKSSIQISDNASEKLEKLSAKIDVIQAAEIVKNKFAGKITSVKLENKNGNLVYTVEISHNKRYSNKKRRYQVMNVVVDAGNGKILAYQIDKIDNNDNENDVGNDENENDNNEAWYKF